MGWPFVYNKIGALLLIEGVNVKTLMVQPPNDWSSVKGLYNEDRWHEVPKFDDDVELEFEKLNERWKSETSVSPAVAMHKHLHDRIRALEKKGE